MSSSKLGQGKENLTQWKNIVNKMQHISPSTDPKFFTILKQFCLTNKLSKTFQSFTNYKLRAMNGAPFENKLNSFMINYTS